MVDRLGALIAKGIREAVRMESGDAAILGAVGTLIAAVIGALGTWYLKILAERNRVLLASKELDLKAKKEDATVARSRETIKELNEAIDQLSADRDLDRDRVHKLRDELHQQGLRLAVCEEKYRACEEDKAELRAHNAAMAAALQKNGFYVPPPLSQPPPGGVKP